ncbi:MAG: AAA family ATPase, partial [Phenylobacterium sp.]|uniref:AAA family ATPase n=1 Tax=Phenylobacterium sp. TaxID=1871053 RepID=UPI001A2505D4
MSEAYEGPKLAWSRESRFRFEAYDDLEPSTKPWLIRHAWPMKGVAFVAGASGAAKTFFAIDATAKIAGGAEKIWGRRAQQRGVIYVAAEDPDGCRARVKAFRRTKGAQAAQAGRRLPFRLVPQPVRLNDPDEVDNFIRDASDQAEAWAEEGTPLGVVCFDTFSVCLDGADENSSAEMSQALAALFRIANELDCLVVVVAHFGKSGTSAGIRGWSGLTANADGVITTERDEEDPELRHVTFSKVKNGPAGSRLDFTLEDVDLGFDDVGDTITSCVVRFAASAKPVSHKRKAGPETKPGPKLILKAFNQL